jgi:hypothetical protein
MAGNPNAPAIAAAPTSFFRFIVISQFLSCERMRKQTPHCVHRSEPPNSFHGWCL